MEKKKYIYIYTYILLSHLSVPFSPELSVHVSISLAHTEAILTWDVACHLNMSELGPGNVQTRQWVLPNTIRLQKTIKTTRRQAKCPGPSTVLVEDSCRVPFEVIRNSLSENRIVRAP